MNEERMTYAELKLPYPKKQNKRHPTGKRREFTWKIIAISLGMICFLLLLVITVLGYMIWIKDFQISSVNKTQTMTETPEVEDHPSHPALPPLADKDYNTCQEKWSCCGENCYHFSKAEGTWTESKKSCQDLGSSLIKIESKEEQTFLQSKIKYRGWIGLHKKGANHPWVWLDNSTPSQKLNFQESVTKANCGFLKPTNIATADCTKRSPFICKKKISCLNN
ncbi:natural killer cells antigen CD94-like [Myotis daubentonii]|uniref:natural killer cells antigen CD94-like n=1 Tax=Myotis daubentonii TaxID=98922 RepID=UPI002872F5B4|nr:natural killer cells antigen CD94-like [Myotis daubentonii]